MAMRALTYGAEHNLERESVCYHVDLTRSALLITTGFNVVCFIRGRARVVPVTNCYCCLGNDAMAAVGVCALPYFIAVNVIISSALTVVDAGHLTKNS